MRANGNWRLVAALMSAIIGLLSGSAFAQQRIGNASSVSNQVEGVIAGASRTLVGGSDVHLNELVRTGEAGVARLVFLDDTNLGVGPRSEVRLDRFVYNPDRSAGSVVVRTGRGVFRFATGVQQPQNYVIQTPIASIGVRGTIFDLVVTLDRMIVTLVSGQIRVTTRQGQAASLTTPGASLTIYAGGAILRRADWGGTPPPDFAALFGSARLADRSSWGTRASPADHRIAIGLSFGGAALVRLPTNSSSGFYTGDLDQGALGLLIGISAFTDVARFGNAPGPFGTGIVSLGIVVDDIIGTALQWKGLCGGAPCDGSGHLNELNVIGEIKLTTPISTTDSANVYVGGGLATLWPTGTPTGAGGPSFVGHASAPAVRVGFGFDRRYSDTFAAGFKVGAQHTFATEFDTTLVGERFRFSGKTEILFAVTLTFSP